MLSSYKLIVYPSHDPVISLLSIYPGHENITSKRSVQKCYRFISNSKICKQPKCFPRESISKIDSIYTMGYYLAHKNK